MAEKELGCVHEHRVYYYETDQMGCVYHANYVRWFEESRIAQMDSWCYPYAKMESAGIGSPVIKIELEYKSMALFNEICEVRCFIEEYTGTRINYAYEVTDKATGNVRCTGKSYHCFRNAEGKIVSLKREMPELDRIVRETADFKEIERRKKEKA